ncbi:MAG: response regulator [Bacteroidia bacterium]|jgi:CheY-like chemotaxis protein
MKNKKICIIDDEEIIQFIVKTILQNLNDDISILSYKNGEEALLAFKEMDKADLPDIILLDINMPVMGGWQFLDEFIKSKAHNEKKIAIYILSSSTAPGDKIRAKVYKDIIGYINKPIEADTLKKITEFELI